MPNSDPPRTVVHKHRPTSTPSSGNILPMLRLHLLNLGREEGISTACVDRTNKLCPPRIHFPTNRYDRHFHGSLKFAKKDCSTLPPFSKREVLASSKYLFANMTVPFSSKF